MSRFASIALAGLLIAEAASAAGPAVRTLQFSGYTWSVKNSAGQLWGPGPNLFSDSESNVWVDDAGRLHLKIAWDGAAWRCAEVISQASFGYGTYRFVLDTAVDDLDPQAVLGLFTWSDRANFNHREIDIEFARWGNAQDFTNAQYVVQPYSTPGNLLRWTLQPGYLSSEHSFRWTASSVAFSSKSAGNPLQQWSYTRRNAVPRAGGENARINLWLFQGRPPQRGAPVEVVISRFEFTP